MLVLNLQFWEGDKAQAMALARLIADMEPNKRKDVVFLFSSRFDCEHDSSTVEYVSQKFANVLTFTARRKATGWPEGPNQLYADSYQFCIELKRDGKIKSEAVLFMEADCVPLRVGWIDELIAEYKGCGKPVLGALILNERGNFHINGNCIISIDFWRKYRRVLNPSDIAWDAEFASLFVPNAAPSRLIFSDYHLGVKGYNDWKDCHYLFEPKMYCEGHPLAGETIKPAWFHGPKDMRGIECVRRSLFGEVPLHQEKNLYPAVGPTVYDKQERPAKEPVTDIFVVTYWRDAAWLEYLLRSIQKYARGFRQTIVVYPSRDSGTIDPIVAKFQNTKGVHFDEASDGHMHHNIIKCTADTYSDADYFLHIDSDCVFLERTLPSDYMTGGRPDLIHSFYSDVPGLPWREVTERALGIKCESETMRRHPFLYPRELYKLTRDRVELVNKMPFSQYVFTAPKVGGAHRGFSEFNALGCTGLYLHPELFNIRNTKDGLRPSHVRQYWSWSGMTEQERFELEWVTKDYDKPTAERDKWAEIAQAALDGIHAITG